MLIACLCPEAGLGMNFRKRDVCFAQAPTSHILSVMRKLPRTSTLHALVPAAVGTEQGEATEPAETTAPPFLCLPQHGKPDQEQAQGLCAAPASAEAVQLLPE